jgi:hypothetical protein
MNPEYNIYIGDRDALSQIKDEESGNARVLAAAAEPLHVFCAAKPRNPRVAAPPRRHLAVKRGPSIKRVARIAERIHAKPEFASLDLEFIRGVTKGAYISDISDGQFTNETVHRLEFMAANPGVLQQWELDRPVINAMRLAVHGGTRLNS